MEFLDEYIEREELANKQSEYMGVPDTKALMTRALDRLAHRPIDTGWKMFDAGVMALLPGTMLILAGSPGTRKSMLALMLHMRVIEAGHRSAYLPFEMERDEHLKRISAISSGSWASLDKRDAERAVLAIEKNEESIKRYGVGIWESPYIDGAKPTPEYVLEWMRQMTEVYQCRLITVDPFSVIAWPIGKELHRAEHDFVTGCRRIADQSTATICIVCHTIKGGEGIQGSATLERISDCVIRLSRVDDYVMMKAPGGMTVDRKVDAELTFSKCRHGPGVGMRIGYSFDESGPTWREEGIIQEEKKKR
jgi:KaiC/GvpD/RAD55 family RecA-like ATPase